MGGKSIVMTQPLDGRIIRLEELPKKLLTVKRNISRHQPLSPTQCSCYRKLCHDADPSRDLISFDLGNGVKLIKRILCAQLISCDKMGVFKNCLCTLFNTRYICRPLNSTVSEDAGIEPRTMATLAFPVRCSNGSARSHPLNNDCDRILRQ